jgi:hypothetical protein
MRSGQFCATPSDSRYTPFTQQAACCVPTSIQMIMYRRGIPLIPAEELGYHLGLTVPPDEARLFHHVRTADAPPSAAGYGTQIYNPAYEPNRVFAELGIPLHFRMTLAGALETESDLLDELGAVASNDGDALLCFNHGVVRGGYEPNSGHVAVFDRIVEGGVRIVDASPVQPKWRVVAPAVLLDAIQRHGNENSGGIWHFTGPPGPADSNPTTPRGIVDALNGRLPAPTGGDREGTPR